RIVADAPTQLEAIVRFLAVLELYKQGVVDLEQFDTFEDLRVRRLREGETALDAASLAEWDEPADAQAERARSRRQTQPSETAYAWTTTRSRTRPRVCAHTKPGVWSRRWSWRPLTRSTPDSSHNSSSSRLRASKRSAVSSPTSTTRGVAASCWSRWPVGTGTRRTPTWPPTSSGSSSRASTHGCPRPRSRRWRSSPTSSPSPVRRSPPSAASTSSRY